MVNIGWGELLVAFVVVVVLAAAAFAIVLPVVRRSLRPVLPPSPDTSG